MQSHRTSTPRPPSRRNTAPLAQRVQSSIERAKTLVQEGYRLFPSEARPLTYCVYKPNQQPGNDRPSYHVVLWHDPDRGEPLERAAWRYRCDCHLYREQEVKQQRGDLDSYFDYCACKHGEASLTRFLRLLTETSALLGYCPYPPGQGATVAAPSANRFKTAPKPAPLKPALLKSAPVAAPPAVSDPARNDVPADPAHPWPTRRAIIRPSEDFD